MVSDVIKFNTKMSNFKKAMGCFLLFANAYSMQMHIFIHIQHATANIICYKGHTVSLSKGGMQKIQMEI